MADEKNTVNKTVAKTTTKTSTLQDITFDYRKKRPLAVTGKDNKSIEVYFSSSANVSGFSRANKKIPLSQIEAKPVYYIKKNPALAKYSSATAEQLAEIQKLSIQDAQNLYR